MTRKKTLFSSIAGIVIVAAMSFGVAQAFASPVKKGFAPGCVDTPGCTFGGINRPGGTRICCVAN